MSLLLTTGSKEKLIQAKRKMIMVTEERREEILELAKKLAPSLDMRARIKRPSQDIKIILGEGEPIKFQTGLGISGTLAQKAKVVDVEGNPIPEMEDFYIEVEDLAGTSYISIRLGGYMISLDINLPRFLDKAKRALVLRNPEAYNLRYDVWRMIKEVHPKLDRAEYPFGIPRPGEPCRVKDQFDEFLHDEEFRNKVLKYPRENVYIEGVGTSLAQALVRIHIPNKETRDAAPPADTSWPEEVQRGYKTVVEGDICGFSVDFYRKELRHYEYGMLQAFFAMELSEKEWEEAWEEACYSANRQEMLLEELEEADEEEYV